MTLSKLSAEREFGPHTTFMVGKPLIRNDRVAVVYSTENFLLNGWRALQHLGSTRRVLQMCFDTTWRPVLHAYYE